MLWDSYYKLAVLCKYIVERYASWSKGRSLFLDSGGPTFTSWTKNLHHSHNWRISWDCKAIWRKHIDTKPPTYNVRPVVWQCIISEIARRINDSSVVRALSKTRCNDIPSFTECCILENKDLTFIQNNLFETTNEYVNKRVWEWGAISESHTY